MKSDVEPNWHTHIREFSKIITNVDFMAAFLDIASKKRRTYEEIAKDIGIDLPNAERIIKVLEGTGLIERNPDKESQKFKLTFSGELFAEQLKTIAPDTKKVLDEKSLISPIKIENK